MAKYPPERLRGLKRGGSPGRPKANPEVREWVTKLLQSPEYRESLTRRLIAGQAAHVEKAVLESFFPRASEVTVSGDAEAPLKVLHVIRQERGA